MKLSEYLKPALGVAFVAVWPSAITGSSTVRSPEEKDTPGQALVIVTKSTNACFSDMVRVTGFIVPRRERRSASIRRAPASPTCSSRKATRSPKIRNWRASLRRRKYRAPPPAGPGRSRCAPRRRPRHRGQDRGRRSRLAAGRPDVPYFREQ
jgi:hypothetical protein